MSGEVLLNYPVYGGDVYGNSTQVFYLPKGGLEQVISASKSSISETKYVNGVYTETIPFYGFSAVDSNNDSFTDKVQFDKVAVVTVKHYLNQETIDWGIVYLSETGKDYTDYTPSLDSDSGSSSEATGGTSPELLAIENEKLSLEKERRVEEKKAYIDLHSEEIVTTIDDLGNEITHVKGHYPSMRAHKYYESHETQWGLNQAEILRHEMKAEEFEKTVASAGVDPFAQLKFNAEVEFDTIVSIVDNKLKDFTLEFDISSEAIQRARGLLPLNDV